MAPYFSPNSAGDRLAVMGDLGGGGGDGLIEPLHLVDHRVAHDEPPRDAKSLVVHHQRLADGHAGRDGNSLKFLHQRYADFSASSPKRPANNGSSASSTAAASGPTASSRTVSPGKATMPMIAAQVVPRHAPVAGRSSVTCDWLRRHDLGDGDGGSGMHAGRIGDNHSPGCGVSDMAASRSELVVVGFVQ